MKEKTLLMISIGALLLAAFLLVRISFVKADFSRTVNESHRTTEGYDQRFIDRVNRFEQVLQERVTFGYPGGKDPMTGSLRHAAEPGLPTGAIGANVATAPAKSVRPRPAAPAPVHADPLRLTAVISDPKGKHLTALVMQGERSFSVDIGDHVSDGRVAAITNEGILIETAQGKFFHDLNGHVEKRP